MKINQTKIVGATEMDQNEIVDAIEKIARDEAMRIMRGLKIDGYNDETAKLVLRASVNCIRKQLAPWRKELRKSRGAAVPSAEVVRKQQRLSELLALTEAIQLMADIVANHAALQSGCNETGAAAMLAIMRQKAIAIPKMSGVAPETVAACRALLVQFDALE